MDIQLSGRVGRVKPSPTLAVSALAAQLKASGRDIIGLGVGEPDFDTPDHIKQAGIEAIQKGETRYTAVDGTPALKQAIIRKFKRDNGLDYSPKQILVSCGGKQSFYNLCQALLNAGDEVIIPAPYWVSYPDMVLLADGEPVIVEAGQAENFKLSAAKLEAAITPKTRLFVINSPSNPTGVTYTLEELAALGEVLRRHPQVLIATDDMYEHVLFAGKKFVNILNACPDLFDRTIVLNGVSKAYAMTGWRIGYAGGPEKLIQAMNIIQSQSTSNPTSISQYAARVALDGDQSFIKTMVDAFEQRHAFVLKAFNAMDGVECLPADGTFYSFPNMAGMIKRLGLENDLALSAYLLDKTGVAVVPGSAFGLEGHIRISFATSMANLEDALARIAAL
ncbi:MAG: pyridoxal phosphate-dependent aminotransferase [Thiothrix sp.]|uniref:pyridoxal phosphate-dependent aminotransferase n=1 Tax=Thiothrix sp. TaxID=1032 RepID=UPI00262515A6|nr:pyridoxal phosphate-dependent aminotransferase [Thiothrix sp.]MDD5393908.1 pyridoxal phosphate-dependent aminotransferase [Thiothrix sp.]